MSTANKVPVPFGIHEIGLGKQNGFIPAGPIAIEAVAAND
jgi:hypothetical protein